MLEGAGGVVAGNALAEAEAVGAGLTGLTVSAGAGDPFDADSIADFEAGGVGAGTEFGDFAHAFVAAYLAWLGWKGEETPLFCSLIQCSGFGVDKSTYGVGHDTQVRVAYAGVSSVVINTANSFQ